MNFLEITKNLHLITMGFILVMLSIIIKNVSSFRQVMVSKHLLGVLFIGTTSFLWTLCLWLSLQFIHSNPEISKFCLKISPVIGMLLTLSYFYSTLAFTSQCNFKLWMWVQLGIVVVISILMLTPAGIKEVVSIYPLKRTRGWGDVILRLWLTITIFYSIYQSIKYNTSLPKIEREKIQVYILSLSLFFLAGVIFSGLLPLAGYEKLIHITPVFSIFWVFTLIYSMCKYKFLDLDIVVCDMMNYGVFILLLLLINYLGSILFHKVLGFSITTSSAISLVCVGILFFAFPLRERINNTVRNMVLKKRTIYQKLLEDAARAVIEILDLNTLIDYLLREIHRALGASKIALFLKEEDEKDESGRPLYRLVAKYGIDNIETVYLKNYHIINWLKKHKEPFLLDIAWATMEKQQYQEITKGLQMFGAVIVIPISYKDDIIGILTLDQKKTDGTVFDIEDIEVLKSLADHFAVAIQNSRLYKELDDAYLQITRALALTLESKQEYLLGHSDKVTKYAVMLAKKMGLSEKDIFIITQAAILHDLGKIGIHDYILTKPDKLTKEEWEEIKQHPIKGERILKSLPFLKDVAKVVRHHHEHYDGTGYPDGLKGEEIPLNARILTLAECVDAMLSERPYRQKGHTKLTKEEVIEELKRQKGKHFDPVLVDKFLELVSEYPSLFESTN